jgi:hypothetical protein
VFTFKAMGKWHVLTQEERPDDSKGVDFPATTKVE